MRENRGALTSVSCCTTLLNETGTWRTQRPVYEANISPCRSACPAGNNIPEWLGLVKEGELQKAWEVIAENNPFVFTCGRVCPHPCEADCNRGQFDETLSIRDMERFLGEEAIKNNWLPQKVADAKEDKVAIIGSGPAGLSCAYQLARRGYSTTVFEALPEPGGMMRFGIPEYRLPRKELDAEIDLVKTLGVEIRTNTKVESLDELFAQGYNAVFLALGAHCGTKLGVEGEDSTDVIDGVTFLRNISSGEKVNMGDKVAVIGGGNVAIDSARTALRLGAKEVVIIYRRSLAEMPAFPEEIEEATKEGVNIVFLAAPARINRHNRRVQLTCIRMELGEPDASGRRRPMPIRDSEFSMDFDAIITAIGETPDVPEQLGLELGRGSTIRIDPDTLVTNRQGIFAGGDVVTGPATVIEAIAAGSKAARSIDRYLRDESLPPEENGSRAVEFEELNLDYFKHQARQFQIRNHVSAGEEASRCFSCGYCNLCGNCWVFCPDIAILQKEDRYEINYDYCKGCGICVEECPTKSMSLEKEPDVKEAGDNW